MNQSLMICKHTYWSAGMAEPGGRGGVRGEGTHVPPDFGRSVNPISTRGADYAHQISTFPPPPDFQTFLHPCPGI